MNQSEDIEQMTKPEDMTHAALVAFYVNRGHDYEAVADAGVSILRESYNALWEQLDAKRQKQIARESRY